MAFVSQQDKAKLAPAIKAILKKYKLKGSLAVRHHSTLVLNIKGGAIDFIRNYNDEVDHNFYRRAQGGNKAVDHIRVNPYWYHEHFTGVAKQALGELIEAMRGPDYFDHSDAQVDYFHRSHYYDINIGNWNKPYQLEG